jgi:hypothetical protein
LDAANLVRRLVVEGTVRPHGVVVDAPRLDLQLRVGYQNVNRVPALTCR